MKAHPNPVYLTIPTRLGPSTASPTCALHVLVGSKLLMVVCFPFRAPTTLSSNWTPRALEPSMSSINRTLPLYDPPLAIMAPPFLLFLPSQEHGFLALCPPKNMVRECHQSQGKARPSSPLLSLLSTPLKHHHWLRNSLEID